MQITKLNKSDYNEILKVWEASVRATHDFISEDDIKFYKDLIYTQALDQVKLFGIKENNTLKGYIALSDNLIEMLFVDPLYFGQGIGSILLNYAIKDLNYKKIDVNEQNKNALKFYQNKGFKINSRSELDSSGRPYPTLHLSL